ncbi:MAG: hypothetical protein R2712_12340 [Vicinamibacterales bacterium]
MSALRFLTDALMPRSTSTGASLPHGDRSIVHLLAAPRPDGRAMSRWARSCCPGALTIRCSSRGSSPTCAATWWSGASTAADLDRWPWNCAGWRCGSRPWTGRLPFSFLDHKIKVGNALVGAWLDTFRHYPVMALEEPGGGDRSHNNREALRGCAHSEGA